MGASLEDVTVTALLPRTLAPASGERVRRCLGQPLEHAISQAFADLAGVDELDPGSYWVIREVRTAVDIGVAEPDPARSAARIARAMADAVARAILDGPTTEATRFSSPARYVADYLRGRLVGVGTGWVFERLRTLDALPPLDAVGAAARVVDVALLDVVGEIVRAGDWDRALAASDPAALARLDGAIARLSPVGEPVDAARLEEAREVRAQGALAGARSPAEGRLRVLGRLARHTTPSPADVAAVWSAEPEPPEQPAPTADHRAPSAEPPPGAPAPAVGARRGHDAAEPVAPLLRCAGAPAFLLLPDLAELLAEDTRAAWLGDPDPAAAEVRAEVLRAVLGRDVRRDDPGVRLAAGVETWPPEGPTEHAVLPVLTDPWLLVEHRDDAAWFAPTLADSPALVPLARALARRFAAHLLGLGSAGLPYLAERVLPLGGTIAVGEDAVLVDLPRPPLHVLLAMAGLDAFSIAVPWLDLPVLLTHEEG